MSTTEKRLITLKESDALRAMPAMNPQALLAAAVDKGASVETLERLVSLTKDLRAIAAKEAFDKAMSEFQRRCPPIKKNKTMSVPGRPTYKYADLGEILSTIAPLMGELGLSVSWRSVQPAKSNYLAKVCIISHEMGHEKDSGPCELPTNLDGNRMNGAQSIGSTETYAKRYSLCSVLGISPEDDTDANDGTEGRNHGGASSPTPTSARPSGAPLRAESTAAPHQSKIVTEDGAPPRGIDPDDPALVTESRNLFPTQEDDVERERIWTEIVKLSAKIAETKTYPKDKKQWDADKSAAWVTNCGAATPSTADLSALNDLLAWLKTREPK